MYNGGLNIQPIKEGTYRKWELRCSTDEMAAQASQWSCPLEPTAIQAETPAQGNLLLAFSANLYLNNVGGALCQDSADRFPTLQGDCIHVKDKTLKMCKVTKVGV